MKHHRCDICGKEGDALLLHELKAEYQTHAVKEVCETCLNSIQKAMLAAQAAALKVVTPAVHRAIGVLCDRFARRKEGR